MEALLISFSHNIFYPIKDKTFTLSSANALNLVESKILHLVKNYIFPKQPILDSSYLKEFTDNNFKFNENSGKFLKGQKMLLEKKTWLLMRNFLVFLQSFQRIVLHTCKTQDCLRKEVCPKGSLSLIELTT